MEQRYIRNLGALTEEECCILRTKKVFVAGCGGIGGHVIDMLLRVGVGAITAADGDCFEESNLNRQLLSAVPVLGKGKAETALNYSSYVNPSVNFTAISEFVTADNAEKLIDGCDAVIDALDSIDARLLLKAACDRKGIPYIYGAIGGWTAQAALSMPGDGLLDILYPEKGIKTTKSVLSFTPALCAGLQCSICVQLLCGRAVTADKLYMVDLEDPEMCSIQLG